MKIQKKAYAKINLYLKILDKRADGYHNIFTVMQKISLCDDIKININKSSGQKINIICAAENIPADKTNTAHKAAELFFERAKISDINTDIEITKKIPSQAGLGGGSSDAASVLLGLNEYYNFILPENILLELAVKIGADVPFFVKDANCAVCEGIGESVAPKHIDLSGLLCLVVKPAYNVSTKQAYDDFDKYCRGRLSRAKLEIRPPVEVEIVNIIKNIHNDFAKLIFSQNKNIAEIKDLLTESGAVAVGLSGSGSALFAVFDDSDSAGKCVNAVNQRNDIEFCDIFDFMC